MNAHRPKGRAQAKAQRPEEHGANRNPITDPIADNIKDVNALDIMILS